MGLQRQGFTAKQVDAPKAVFAVPEGYEPGWIVGMASVWVWVWVEVPGEYTPHHVFFVQNC